MSKLDLCLVTQISSSFDAYLQRVEKAVQGGVTMVQLRDKQSSRSQLKSYGLTLKALLKPYRVPLMINDQVDLALEIDADGVHLGQSDIDPAHARQILGPNAIIGYSVESFEQLEKANQLKYLDYVAASAIFPTLNKADCQMFWGLEGLKKICASSVHPVMAIGGVNLDNACEVIQQGATGVAVIGAIHDHADPLFAAQALTLAIREGKKNVRHGS